MKKIYCLLICLAFNISLFSQSIEQIKSDTITYIWGEGSGTTLKKAEQMASSMILEQIASMYKSKFLLLKSEFNLADIDNNFTEVFNSIMRTYSGPLLKNSEKIVVSNEPDARVFHYMKRINTDNIFAERKNKIIGLTEEGMDALKNNKISDALRYYYWAFTLLRSHPDGSSIDLTSDNQMQNLLATWLPIQINSIFTGLSVMVADTNTPGTSLSINLNIYFHNIPVSNLDYSFWDGNTWSNIISAKDGLGYVDFANFTSAKDDVKLKIEYIFEEEATIDSELRDVMRILDPVPYRNSSLIAKRGDAPGNLNVQGIIAKKTVASDSSWLSRSISVLPEEEHVPFEQVMGRVTASFKTRDFNTIINDFTPEGFKMFQDLVQYGQARILGIPSYRFVRFGDDVICRSIPMNFKFANNYKQFVEDIVFHFNSSGKIFNLSFGLSNQALNDIVNKDTWNEKVRLVLVTFLENYKTAYALKRLSYIESIFSDDALIIVGSVLRTATDDGNKYLDNRIIRYNRYTKTEYLKNLKLSFQSNEFINLKFEDNEIRKSGKGGEIYGIQIRQNYSSTNYGDEGYLFLMVDLNNPDLPIIHVRTWQPQKNPDGSIYGLGDFN
ncbi:MAG: hypothetical protein IPJ16_18135 [Bacteroidales bacterium]|nr:hypothetical protein [Bacteroidales bacterium]